MYDVNPLGPMMHLKQIEREALALRAMTMRDRSRIPYAVSAWVMKALKRLSMPFRIVSPDNSGGKREFRSL